MPTVSPMMSGAQFASNLPPIPGPARERAIYHAVLAGLAAPILWVEVVWRPS